MLSIEDSKDDLIRRKRIKLVFKILSLIILIIILIYLFIYLLETHSMPFYIAFLIVLFLFLFFLGFVLKNKKRSILSLFPAFRESSKMEDRQKEYIKQLSRKPRPDILQFNYQKPLIEKCPNCGIILANFMKKCPNCNYEL